MNATERRKRKAHRRRRKAYRRRTWKVQEARLRIALDRAEREIVRLMNVNARLSQRIESYETATAMRVTG